MIKDYAFNSVENIPNANAAAAFTSDSAAIFREDADIIPLPLSDGSKFIPWGGDNKMPFDILDLIEADETLSTCQLFNAEVCFGSGLIYNTDNADEKTACQVDDFNIDNDINSYFLGVCQDFKHFGWAVSVIILNNEASKILRLIRKEVCYCRFAPADDNGKIPYIFYANWRKNNVAPEFIEKIELLDSNAPYPDLRERIKNKTKTRKFAVLSKIPTPDSTYYPIPYYAAIFKSGWYDIKKIIAVAKKAKLKNSAPIKYQIEISNKYWESIFRMEGITIRSKQIERVNEEKERILEFLTGAENSGKAWFSTFYQTPDGKEQHDVVIHKITDSKEGGDWSTDIQEAVNMICFAMRVHSNLVGSVPGKAQTNNSGSDKRELYTIAHALQIPYHKILFNVHRIIIRFNAWKGVYPESPFIQLTTLDSHTDAKTAKYNG
jgi:hypothetical protein